MASNLPWRRKLHNGDSRDERQKMNDTNNLQGHVANPVFNGKFTSRVPQMVIHGTILYLEQFHWSGASKRPCRYYRKGDCSAGPRCQFLHGNPDVVSPPLHSAAWGQKLRSEAHEFSGRATMTSYLSVGTNETPGQTYQILRAYVEDSFRFVKSEQVYRFLELLCNANPQNTSWVRGVSFEMLC